MFKLYSLTNVFYEPRSSIRWEQIDTNFRVIMTRHAYIKYSPIHPKLQPRYRHYYLSCSTDIIKNITNV